MLVSAGSLQVVPLRGRTGVMGRLVAVDEAAGVPEEDQDQDQFPGEEDQHPEDHRGGAAGAGSPEEKNCNDPSLLRSSRPCWSLDRPETKSRS